MTKHNNFSTRLLSMMLAIAMLTSTLQSTAFATSVGDVAVGASRIECHAAHDGDCGYKEAVEDTAGLPCTHSCELCDVKDSGSNKPAPEVDKCDCTNLCTTDKQNTNCPVCADSFESCTFEVEKAPKCDCTALCTMAAQNTDCSVCKDDFDKCGFVAEITLVSLKEQSDKLLKSWQQTVQGDDTNEAVLMTFIDALDALIVDAETLGTEDKAQLEEHDSYFILMAIGMSFVGEAQTYGLSGEQNLPTVAGSTLANNTVYKVTQSTTITGTPSGNALTVAGAATTAIYIPSGFTLTVQGGSATTGGSVGGAGIYVPNGATLIVTGGGKLIAAGGHGAAGGVGLKGDNPYDNGSNVYRGGSTIEGQAGAGGGGAGAGIGGGGGAGGAGLSVTEKPVTQMVFLSTTSDTTGSRGRDGTKGGDGMQSGTVYMLGSVTVNATGGNAGDVGNGGAAGTMYTSSSHPRVGAGGGGGGGGGGYGSAAVGIGGGAAGGGSGGSGSYGGQGYNISSTHISAGGNGGSGGAPYGQGGVHGSSSTNWGAKGNTATATTGGANVDFDVIGEMRGGIGGAGGNAGSAGASGKIYKSSTATVTGASGTVTTPPNTVQYTVTLNSSGATISGTTAVTATLGEAMPNITVPTKTSYVFMGYYSLSGGAGTKYYNRNGSSAALWDSATITTLYAHFISIPTVVANQESTNSFLYGNGNPLLVVGTSSTQATIYIDYDRSGTLTDYDVSVASAGVANAPADNSNLSNWGVYSAWKSGNRNGDMLLTVRNATLYTAAAGIYDSDYTLTGSSTVNIYDSTIDHLYANGSNGWLTGDATISIDGGTFKNVMIGGWPNRISGKRTINLSGNVKIGSSATSGLNTVSICYRGGGTVGNTSTSAPGYNSDSKINIGALTADSVIYMQTANNSNALKYTLPSGTILAYPQGGATISDSNFIDKNVRSLNVVENKLVIGEPISESKITIKISDATTDVSGASLQAAITKGGFSATAVTSLKITAGEVTTADWNYIKSLTKLTTFEIGSAATPVANIPNGTTTVPIFPISIKSVTVPQAITIGDSAFRSCSALTTAIFPAATTIGEHAFNLCKALTTVSFPVATIIGGYAFYGCSALTSVSFPVATTIGGAAFTYCTALTTASFPVVTTIGGAAISNCTTLATLTLGATPPQAESNTFTDLPTPRDLVLVNASGTALTGEALAAAQTAYDTVALGGGSTTDNLWYGWTVRKPAPTISGTNINANGNALLITGASDTSTTIYIDTNRNGILDTGEKSLKDAGVSGAPADNSNLSTYIIHGGSKSAALTGNTKITVTGGKVANVYIGGYDTGANVNGDAEFVMSGGTVGVVLGAYSGNITGRSMITMSGGNANFVSTGTQNASIGSGVINISGSANISDGIGGTGNYGEVENDLTITVSGNATVRGITACTWSSGTNIPVQSVKGKITINLNGGTIQNSVICNNDLSDAVGTKTINVSGNARVGNGANSGIDLLTTTSKKVNITSALTDGANITLINPSSTATGTIVATASVAENADAGKLTLAGRSLIADGVNIKIAPIPTISSLNIFANGNALLITGASDASTTIYIDSNRNGVLDTGEKSLKDAGVSGAPANNSNLSTYSIYGGSKDAQLTGDTQITMNSGAIFQIIGGGNSAAGMSGGINGNTNVTVNGGTVTGNIYGGCTTNHAVTGDATVNINGGNLFNVLLSGSGSLSSVGRNATANITGGTITRGVGATYAGNSATKTINISGNPVIAKNTDSGIYLSHFTDSKVNITGELTGNTGDIKLTGLTNPTDGTVVATATTTSHADASKFTLAGKNLMADGKDIKIGFKFTTLEIREKTADGRVVVDLLDSTSVNGNWAIDPDADYYLYGALNKEAATSHIQIRYGNDDSTYNGVTFANPPGGGFTPGDIQHDYFDKLSAFTNFDNPLYGPTTGALVLRDGKLTYHIKDSVVNGEPLTFLVGLVVNDAVYDGKKSIIDALSIATGRYNDATKVFTPTDEKSVDLKISDKSIMGSYLIPTTATAELNGLGNIVGSHAIFNDNTVKQAAVLFETFTTDVTYPKGAALDYGFNTVFDKTNSTHGVLSISDNGAETTIGGVTYVTKTLTVTRGYKSLAGTVVIYYRLDFKNNNAEGVTFAPGKYTMTLTNQKITMKNGTVITPKTAGRNQSVTYTLASGGGDATSMSAVDRHDVYNHTVDMGADEYLSTLGTVYIKNGSAGSPSPYEKTYEATFNTTNTAAKITAITVPLGTFTTVNTAASDEAANGLRVTVTGTGAGSPVTLTEEQLLAAAEKPDDLEGSTYLLIYAKDIGLAEITSVKAEIGKISPAYASSTSTNNWGFPYNKASAFGSFTDNGDGNVVTSNFRLYNTDAAMRDRTNGDLTVNCKATSTTRSGAGMNHSSVYLTGIGEGDKVTVKKAIIASDSAVPAGDTAIITGNLFPYAARPAYDITPSGTEYASSMYLKDPIFYLTLPSGLGLDTSKMNFSYANYNDHSKLLNTTAITGWKSEQVSSDGTNTIYKVTMPPNTVFGYYNQDGDFSYLNYTLAFTTEKSLSTQRYRLNDLVTIVTANQTKALRYVGINQGTLVYVKEDTNNWNGGKDVFGLVKDKDDTPMGFGVQQQAEIVVNSAIAVSKINGGAVTPEWVSYSPSNPNSIAMLGQSSEGQVRLLINNTSENDGKSFALLLPIPQKDAHMGSIFMDGAQGFTMSMTNTPAAGSSSAFTVKYAKITGSHSTVGSFFSGGNYGEVLSQNDANALLITANSLAKGTYELRFDYTVANGMAGATDIFRPVYAYTVQSENRQKTGGYVASAVAGSKLTGTVFHDNDGNGVMDNGDSAVSGIQVVARDAQGRTETTTTGADGKYSFTAVREAAVALTFTVQGSESLRFNVQPSAATAGTVSTVLPSTDGRSATRSVYASGDMSVNAAMSGFVRVTYDKNTATGGSLPADSEYTSGSTATVAVKPDNLVKTGYRFKGWNTTANGSGTAYQPGATFAITANTTLYAIWEIADYAITFHYRGATGGNSEITRRVEHNTRYGGGTSGAYTKPLPNPTKTGYTFRGWTRIVTATTANVTDATRFTLGEDTILYAIWAPKTSYVVHYADTGTNQIPDKTGVAWDGGVLPQNAPTKDGYLFDGWVCGGTRATAYTVFCDLAVSDADNTAITLTALWRAKSGFTVKYDANGGSGVLFDKTGVSWSQTNLLPPQNPTRENHAFDGWTLSGTAQAVIATDSYGALAKRDTVTAVTLKAAWKVLADNMVRYDVAGGSSISDKNGVKTTDAGLLPTNNPARAGYTFDGWYYGNTKVEAATVYNTLTTERMLTLTAKWSAKSYTIKYATGNTTTISDIAKSWQEAGLLPAATLTKDGYTFDGWYYENTRVSATSTVSALIPADDKTELTLTARWIEKTYTVLYDTDGGNYIPPRTGVKYTAVNLLPDTAAMKTGYALHSWQSGGVSVTESTTVSALNPTGSTVSIKAQWTAKTGYTVLYDANGGSFAADQTKSGVLWTGKDLLPTTPPTRPGYILIGWKSGRNTVIATTAFSALAAGDAAGTAVTLVAQWAERADYAVKYVTDCTTDIADKANVKWNQRLLLPSENLSRDGYAFTGWYHEKEDGSKARVSNTEPYSALASADDDHIILRAGWDEKAHYIVSFDTDGGGSIPDKNAVFYESMTNLLPTEIPVKYGQTFEGWTYQTDSGEIVDVTNGMTYASIAGSDTVESITLTAKWEQKSFAIRYEENGGSTVEDRESILWVDSPITPEAESTRMGYRLTGWYYGDVLVTDSHALVDILEDDSSTEITLTADWEERGYTIHYNTDGGNSIGDKTDVRYSDDRLLPAVSPEKAGHSFAGWFYGNTEVKEIGTSCADLLGDAANNITELTLNAHWTVIGGYTVEYDTVGAGYLAEKAGVKWTDKSLAPTADGLKKEGYSLTGWKCGDTTVTADTTFGTLATSDLPGTRILLTAIWTEKSGYAVKYDLKGGTHNSSTSVVDKTGVKWTDAGLLPAPNPARNHYAFGGWALGENLVGNDTPYALLAATDTTTSVTLAAKWNPIRENTVKYETGLGATVIADKTNVAWDDTGLLPPAPTKPGFAFAGWKCGGTDVLTATKYSDCVSGTEKTITLTAQWTENSYTVRYDTAGGSTIADKAGVKWADSGLLPTAPTKEHYTFGGWIYGESTEVTGATKYSDLAVNDTVMTVTLTARWTQKAYTVKYNTNGGSTLADKTVYWDNISLIAKAIPMKQNNVFSHWVYGTGESAVIVENSTTYGQLVGSISPVPTDITLNAVYEASGENTGGVEGEIVTDTDKKPIKGVYVSVHVGGTQGTKIAGSVVTGADGKFSFYGLPYGIYTLVATRTLENGETQTITKIITINGTTANGGMVMPSGWRNTIVEVRPGTPPAAANGLDELFQSSNVTAATNEGVTQADHDKVNAGGSLEIRLTVEQKALSDTAIADDLTKVTAAVGANATLIPFDLEVIKTVTESGGSSTATSLKTLPQLIEIVIPIMEIEGKTIQVMRIHGGTLHTLPYTDSSMQETFSYKDGNLHLNVRMFSTYVVAYKTSGGGGGGTGGGSGGGDSHRYYEISLHAGRGGSIYPGNSKVTVREGESAGFDIIPDTGYRIADVKVDGKSVGAVSAYMLRNVQRDHTLSASFEKLVTPLPDPNKPPAGDASGSTKPVNPQKPEGDKSDAGGSSGGETSNGAPEKTDPLEDIKRDVLEDLEQKRDEAITALPETLTQEQRQAAIDEINRIYDEAVKAIQNATSASEISELYNKAVRDFDSVVKEVGGTLPSMAPTGKPFILLSALMALAAVVLAVLALRKRKEDEHKKRKSILATAGAVGAVLTFLLTTGWSGIAFANIWTLLVAVFAGAAAYFSLKGEKEETDRTTSI